MSTDSDSREQRDAEPLMMAALSAQLGVELRPHVFPDGSTVDGFSDSPLILCEAWAHQGRPRGGQLKKVTDDAFKMLYIEKTLSREARKILLMSDADAAPKGWRAVALETFGVEVCVVEIDAAVREGLRAAQVRQYR